jgi:response regulator RpfG family c-di-GMP phosphodiesterase
MKKLLLIIEDNTVMADSLSEFIGDLVDEVIIASTVDEAQDYLLIKSFSLITLDINLKGRNGSEVIKFILDNPENSNKNVPIIIISGMVSPEFIEKNKSRYAGILGKPFQIEDLLETATHALYNIVESDAVGLVQAEVESTLNSFDKIPFLKCKISLKSSDLDERISLALGKVKLHITPKAILAATKIDRNPINYFAAHTEILVNILLAFAIHLGWNSEKTLSKLIYAAYLHDIALVEKPQLAKIHSMQQLAELVNTLSFQDYKLVFEHPNIAETTLAGLPNIDSDVLAIIRQHHELPNETGFPAKISHKKFIPMSALFIIAADFADYILETPRWNLHVYLTQAKTKYTGIVFLKTFAGLADLK